MRTHTAIRTEARDTAGAYDRLLLATRFKSVKSAVGKPVNITLRQFAATVRETQADEKSLLPLISFCSFENNHRSKENARKFSAIALDYDAGIISMERAAATFRKAGILALLYETPSNTIRTPRWRVIVPMSKPLPAARYSQMVGRANGILGGVLARESYSEAQAYFFGSVRSGSPCQTCLT
jgi:hypothetical protein